MSETTRTTTDSAAAAPGAVRSRFRVAKGCLPCAGDVAGGLRRLPGVLGVQVLLASGAVIVVHDGTVTTEAVRQQATQFGLALVPAEEHAATSSTSAGAEQPAASRLPWWQQPKLLALAAASMLLVLGLTAELLGLGTLAHAAYVATLVVGGAYPARSALQALRRRRLTLTTLLAITVAGAVALGALEEAALLVVVFSLGEVLEEYAADRARGSIRALMALTPPTARRRAADGSLETAPVQALVPGDVVVVRPGERLPTDGRVVVGVSAVDQSPVTGESVPVEAGPGVSVFGGTVNGAGALDIEVTKPYADTVLARVIRQVEEAQAHQGQAQRFADRFSAVYTPAMFVLALIVAAVGFVVGDPRAWIYRALVVFTVSCSCALVISVPVAVVTAISRGARDGILIKGGAYLEALDRIRVVAFDKTGTLTQGRPKLTDVVALDGIPPDHALRLAASVEAASEHPLAGAILAGAQARGVLFAPGRELRAIPGVGVEATVEGRRVFVGRADRLATSDGDRSSAGTSDGAATRPSHQWVGGGLAALAELEAQGKTVVVVAQDGEPIGLVAVADELRQETTEVVAALHELGVERVVLLTGDNERVARAIAANVGIEDWRAGLLPEDKTAAVRQLRAEYGTVVMVGDGINDAPALASADIGVAMGAAGTDVALESADVALMADDLTKLPAAIRLARRAMRNIRQNIALSLATVAVLLAAALSGRLSLTSGLLLNEGTALLIIANGLRLLRPRRHQPAPP